MRSYLTGLLVLFLAAASYSQDKVYLANGSVIRGEILEYSGPDSLEIVIQNAKVYIPKSLVEEVRTKNDSLRLKARSYPTGEAILAQIGFLAGSPHAQEELIVRPTFSVGYEYRFFPLLNVGVSGGYQLYSEFNAFPITANYLIVFCKSSGSWILTGSAGHSFVNKNKDYALEYKVKGGFYDSFGVGWQQRTGRNWVRVGAVYSTQTVNEEIRFSPGNYLSRIRKMNRIGFNLTFVIR